MKRGNFTMIRTTKRRGTLLTVLLTALALALTAPATAGAADDISVQARPDFLAPFECDTTWRYFTYEGHGGGGDGELSLDFNVGAGDDDLGMPVLASADGTARIGDAGNNNGGQFVYLDHADGWQSRYYHLDTQTVQNGDAVKRGQQIGTVGKTGGVDWSHLHLEHYENDQIVPIWLEGKELAYGYGEDNASEITSTNGCDGDPGDPEPPVQKDTALAYDGPATVSNGSPATLSATLTEKEAGTPVADREVTIALGEQTCKANTSTEGKAACTIDKVAQPLTDTATVPVKAGFAGDDAYKASEDTAEVKLQYVTGRAYGLSAQVPVLVLPIVIAPTPDTGAVRTADAKSVTPACTQNISAVVLTADALCADVTTTTGPSRSTAKSTLAKAAVGLPGLPVIEVSGVTATSTSTCEASTGTTDLKLSIAGTPVTVPDTPNYAIDLGAGAKLVVNEQVKTANGLTVNALHVSALGGADVLIASSTSGAHNCA